MRDAEYFSSENGRLPGKVETLQTLNLNQQTLKNTYVVTKNLSE